MQDNLRTFIIGFLLKLSKLSSKHLYTYVATLNSKTIQLANWKNEEYRKLQ